MLPLTVWATVCFAAINAAASAIKRIIRSALRALLFIVPTPFASG
jgi:hypothetical protein